MIINVAIVEDVPETREGLKKIVESADDLYCCGTFANAKSFIEKFKHLDVNVVLMDIDLGSKPTGIECVESLKSLRPDVQFMMCTTIDDADKIFNSLKVGATGYILKNTVPDKIISDIKDIQSGRSPMSPEIARKVIQFFSLNKKNSKLAELLTQKEKEVIELLEKGYPYKEIADKLDIKKNTVTVHIQNIYEKLHVTNRTDALNKYFGRTAVSSYTTLILV